MKMKLLLAVASVLMVFTQTLFAKSEDDEALLAHILAPREAIDLTATNEWQFCAVTNGTPWDATNILWKTQKVSSRFYWLR